MNPTLSDLLRRPGPLLRGEYSLIEACEALHRALVDAERLTDVERVKLSSVIRDRVAGWIDCKPSEAYHDAVGSLCMAVLAEYDAKVMSEDPDPVTTLRAAMSDAATIWIWVELESGKKGCLEIPLALVLCAQPEAREILERSRREPAGMP